METHPGQPPDADDIRKELQQQVSSCRHNTDSQRQHELPSCSQAAQAAAVFTIGDGDGDTDINPSNTELVSPKPIITTVTKQAEISPTERFSIFRKLSTSTQSKEATESAGSYPTHHYYSSSSHTDNSSSHTDNMSNLKSMEPLIIYNKVESSTIWSEEYLCDSQVEFMKSEVSNETVQVHEHLRATTSTSHITRESSWCSAASAAATSGVFLSGSSAQQLQKSASSSDNQDTQILYQQCRGARPKTNVKMVLHNDEDKGVRFVLSPANPDLTAAVELSNRQLLAERLKVLANNVFNITNEATEDTGSSDVTSNQTDEHYTAVIDFNLEKTTPNLHLSIMNKNSKPERLGNNNVISDCVYDKCSSPSQYATADLHHKTECKTECKTESEVSHIERPHLVRKEVLTNGLLNKIFKESVAIQELTTPVIYREHVTCMMCHRPVHCNLDGCSSKYCRRHQYLTDDDDDDESTTDSDGTISETEAAGCSRKQSIRSIRSEDTTIANTPRSKSSGSNSVKTTPIPTPVGTGGLVNPGFVFEFPSPNQHLRAEDGTAVPASPSLLDTLHKKYWAHGSPVNSYNEMEQTMELRARSDDHIMKKSEFRARHESYCRVVDENTNRELSISTLPSPKSNAHQVCTTGSNAMRMFGDVSELFSSLPVSAATTSTTTASIGGRKIQRIRSFGSADRGRRDAAEEDEQPTPLEHTNSTGRLVVPTAAASAGSGSTGGSGASKLSRKFSLSPKIIRKRIIARLQQQDSTDKAGSAASSESDVDDLGSNVRIKKEGSQYKKKDTEIEVIDACLWLQQAGFPQYVQLYEDSQFPIDLSAVERDHSFLDSQSLQSLFRRLQVLNKSVHMKLDINNKKSVYGSGVDDDDEDDACVLSDKWQFERVSGRWSHIDAASPEQTTNKMMSCSSRDSLISDNTTEGEANDISSPVLPNKQQITDYRNTSANTHEQSQKSEKRRGGSFLQKVGSLRRSHKQSKRYHPPAGVTISGPTLVQSSDMEERMQRLGCVDINSKKQQDDEFNNNTKLLRSASADGAGVCYCDSSSVDSAGVTDYRLPSDYVLGTFPKELLEVAICPSSTICTHHSTESNTNLVPRTQSNLPTKLANRNSYYDNIENDEEDIVEELPSSTEPQTEARKELDAVLHDLLINMCNLDIGDEDSTNDFLKLYLNNSSKDSKSYLNVDSAIVSPTSEDLSSLTDTPSESAHTPIDTPELKRTSDKTIRAADITTSSEELADNEASGSQDDGMEETTQGQPGEAVWRERRDSGVGSSLTREPTERKKRSRLRWHSFVASHRPSYTSQCQHISSLSAGHLVYLQRIALLKVTGLMEQHSPLHKTGFSLQLVNKFIKKGSKSPDYSEKRVFGVPLSVILQRTGQPLPQCILHAMRYLRKTAADAPGIFRKSGVKSRIQKLRNDIEENPDSLAQFDSMQAYDVADMFKQYLRELPECLVTNKLSETFLAVYQHIPQDERLEALQFCMLLLPDENREVLESLLYFLSDIASFHEENHMTASNLAMCFAPSLFNIHNRGQSKSPKSDRKNTGIPDQKEFLEQKSATDCLTAMITECKKLFRVPDDFYSKCSLPYTEAGELTPLSLLKNDTGYDAHVDSCIQGLLKESKEKGWYSIPVLAAYSGENVDVSYKKVHDDNPLKLWKCCTEIEAPPVEVLSRVLNERQKWDEDLSKWRVLTKLDKQLDVFQYMTTSMAPQPSREYVVLRAWKTDLPKGACALVMHSIDYDTNSLGEGIHGAVLASRYLIEPCGSGKSKLTHISRVDLHGHQAKWYTRCYGNIVANSLIKIKESFRMMKGDVNIHETKV